MNVLVEIHFPRGLPTGVHPLHEFTRVPSVGEKVAIPIQGKMFFWVVTDVMHYSLKYPNDRNTQAILMVRPN
jgi:hypothetical protein